MNNEDKYISLIIKVGEDVAHLKKEIIAGISITLQTLFKT